MTSALAIASSGLQAAQLRLTSSAHNVANLNTEGFVRQTVRSREIAPLGGVEASVGRAAQSGPSLEEDVIEQMGATYAFKANALVLRTANSMLGSLIDLYA